MKETIYTSTLLEIKNNINDIYTFKFTKPNVDWSEGTNVHLAFKDFEEHEAKKYVRHFSITNLPEDDYICITTRKSNSPFKKRFFDIQIGDEMLFYKFKQRMPLRNENKEIILLSMGVGIAAYRTSIKTYKEKNYKINKMTNINISHNEKLFYDEFSKVNQLDNVYVNNRKAFKRQLISSYSKNAVYYIVGSDAFIESSVKELIQLNHNPLNIELDKKEKKKKEILNLK